MAIPTIYPVGWGFSFVIVFGIERLLDSSFSGSEDKDILIWSVYEFIPSYQTNEESRHKFAKKDFFPFRCLSLFRTNHDRDSGSYR